MAERVVPASTLFGGSLLFNSRVTVHQATQRITYTNSTGFRWPRPMHDSKFNRNAHTGTRKFAAATRLMFDGSVVSPCFTDKGTKPQVDSTLFLWGITTSTINPPSALYWQENQMSGCKLQIKYREIDDSTRTLLQGHATNKGFNMTSVEDNVFTMSVDGTYLQSQDNFGGRWGKAVTLDGREGGSDTWFGFIFDTEGDIIGVVSWWQYAILGHIYPGNGNMSNHLLVPWHSVNNPDPWMMFFIVHSLGTLAKDAQAGFDYGTCCTSGYVAGTNGDILCRQLLLSTDEKASEKCTPFMTNSTSGYCAANPTISSCVAYCNKPGVDCDNLYTNYCKSIGEVKAVETDACACFLAEDTTFKKNFTKSLQDVGLATLLSQPDFCRLPKCATSQVRRFTEKPPFQCTSLTTCVANLKVDNHGVMGDLAAGQKLECGVGGTSTNSNPPGASNGDSDGVTIFGISLSWMVIGGVAGAIILVLIVILSSSKPKQPKKRR